MRIINVTGEEFRILPELQIMINLQKLEEKVYFNIKV